ncbi:MAG: DUF4231 domain-containing protein [Aggregatilineaceae bacterium]
MTDSQPSSPDSTPVPVGLIAPPDVEDRRSKWFFMRRVPAWGLSREWTRPPNGQYERELIEEGFIAPSLLGDSMSAELAADIRELDQHLLPHFWRMNQQARFFQNRYYQYQWAFILSAFLTTALAAVNVFLYAQGWTGPRGTIVGTLQWTELLGFLTAVISGIAAAVSFLDANQTPQKRWYKARVQAETLRSMYFLFLARQAPFDSPHQRERVQRMREKVIEVLRETRPVEKSPAQETPSPAPEPSLPGLPESLSTPARRSRRPSKPDSD